MSIINKYMRIAPNFLFICTEDLILKIRFTLTFNLAIFGAHVLVVRT